MRSLICKLQPGSFFLVVLLAASLAAGQQAPNVAGAWNIKVSGDAGNADQTIVLEQDGSRVTGTFKGPRQSGKLEGTLEGNKIQFHVKTRVPLDYTGTVDKDTMKGAMSGRGKTGYWTATRAK